MSDNWNQLGSKSKYKTNMTDKSLPYAHKHWKMWGKKRQLVPIASTIGCYLPPYLPPSTALLTATNSLTRLVVQRPKTESTIRPVVFLLPQ